jgi:hypothetical protein
MLPTILLSLLALASGQLTPQTSNIYNCAVTQYAGVLYAQDLILGDNQFLKATSLQDCVGQCLQQSSPCIGINYLQDQGLCSFSTSAVTDPNQDPSTYQQVDDSVHAYINCAPQAPSAPVGCGKQAAQYKPTLNRLNRIIGGTEAKPFSWPWLTSLTVDFGNGYEGNCGSSLLRVRPNVEASDIILTAAHCVTDEATQGTTPTAYPATQMKLVAGCHRRDQYNLGEQHRTGAQVTFHPQFIFTPQTGANNDIAMIKLDRPINFTDTIRPICLPQPNEALPVGKFCAVAGWGRINPNNNDVAQALQQSLAPVYSAATCAKGWGDSYIENMMVCAGSLNGTYGTCQGDSGGTLACQQKDGSWTVYGAVSFGVSGTCLQAGLPSIFTRVSSYMDWVTQNMNSMTSL